MNKEHEQIQDGLYKANIITELIKRDCADFEKHRIALATYIDEIKSEIKKLEDDYFINAC